MHKLHICTCKHICFCRQSHKLARSTITMSDRVQELLRVQGLRMKVLGLTTIHSCIEKLNGFS